MKNANHYNMLNEIRVEIFPLLKQNTLTGNMQEVLAKVFINMTLQTITNKLSKDSSKSTEDVFEMIKGNSTEAQNQNRACLIKIVFALSESSRITST